MNLAQPSHPCTISRFCCVWRSQPTEQSARGFMSSLEHPGADAEGRVVGLEVVGESVRCAPLKPQVRGEVYTPLSGIFNREVWPCLLQIPDIGGHTPLSSRLSDRLREVFTDNWKRQVQSVSNASKRETLFPELVCSTAGLVGVGRGHLTW